MRKDGMGVLVGLGVDSEVEDLRCLVWEFWFLGMSSLAGSDLELLSLAVLSPAFSSLDFSLSTTFSSLPALILSLLAPSSSSSTELPIATIALVSSSRGAKYCTTAERADLGNKSASLGEHTNSFFSPFGGAKSSTRNRDKVLEELLLEMKA